jgi:hypothetical protein
MTLSVLVDKIRLRMTPNQVRITEWLEQEVPTLHPAYVQAAQLMAGPDFPGRCNQVCHACRDICTVIQQYHRVEKTVKAGTTKLLNELDTLWSQRQPDNQVNPAGSAADGNSPTRLPEDVKVKPEIIQAIHALLLEHRRGSINQKNQALDMFQILAPEAAERPDLFDVHAEQWRDLRGWFHEHAHYTLKEQRRDAAELQSKVSLLETHLLSMVSTFYEGVADLDEILEQEPTEGNVSRAIARMSRLEQQRYFFERLQNPDWIEPLKQKGVFDVIPQPRENEDRGTISFFPWPPARYLTNMASERPAVVAQIFAGLTATENPFIVKAMLDATQLMPPDIAVTLASKIVKLLDIPFWFTSDLVGKLTARLASGGQTKAALQLLRALLQVKSDPRTSLDPAGASGRRREARPVISGFDYTKTLRTHGPDLAMALGLQYLTALCRLLRISIHEEIPLDKGAAAKTEDYSSIWKARLEGYSHDEAAKQLLVPGVLDAAETLCALDASNVPSVISTLGRFPYKVFDRVALQILARHAGDAFSIARDRLLDKASFLDLSVRQEYDALAAAIFGQLEEDDQKMYLAWIDEGGDQRRFEGGDYTAEAIANAADHWKFQRLSALRTALPADRHEQFAAMEARFGEARSYTNPIAQGGAYDIGGESPLTRESMGAMGPGEVIARLRSWQPSPDDPFPFGYSREGFGAVFAAVVTDLPERYASLADEIKTLDAAYVSGAVRGFASAIQRDKDFDVAPVLALSLWVAEQPASKAIGAEEDATSDLSGAKHNVIELISEGLKRKKLPSTERETIWKTIDLLSDDEWGTLDYREPKAQEADAWSHSVNYLRPKAVRGAIQFLQWSMDSAGQSTFAFSDVPELAQYFEKHTDPSCEPCLSVRLIFGEKFPYLQAWDPTWAKNAIDRIFPNVPDLKALRDVAWTAYLAANPAYDAPFAMLEPHYRASITIPDGERLLGRGHMLESPSGLLGKHLLQEYWRGKIPITEGSLLGDFFLLAEERARRAAIIYSGSSLREAPEPVQPEVIERFVELWNNRLEAAKAGGASGEIRAFSWWFFTSYFDDEWALKSLHAGLKLTNGELELIMDSLGRLSELAGKYPTIVVECVQMITNASPDYVELWTPDIVKIVKIAFASNDPAAHVATRTLIDSLGIRGHLGFRTLLADHPTAVGREANADPSTGPN